MSIFRRPETRSSVASLAATLTSLGIPVRSSGGSNEDPSTPSQALRHTTVWACVNFISENVATLPVGMYRSQASGSAEVPSALIDTPSGQGIPDWAWRSQFLVSLLTEGNAYGLITETDRQGWPTQIDWLDPMSVTMVTTGGETRFRTPTGSYAADEISHTPGLLLPGSRVGLSPIGMFRRTIGLGLSAEKFGSGWFSDGAHPSSIISSDQELTNEDAKEIKAAFQRAVTGREPAVMGGALKYTPISVPANESQFLESIQANGTMIAGQIFRVAPEMIGLSAQGSAITYASLEGRAQHTLTFTFAPWVSRLESMLTRSAPRGQFAKVSTGAFLRTDLKGRYDAYALAIRNGFRSVNEIRALEDEPGIGTAGDQYIPLDRLMTSTSPATLPASGGSNAQAN